ncbi:MAG: hypothetical protein HRU41_01470 [Saprospiraceae bacterium]|nr:hypothetical protein [Saprospiraceae bacterium]
MKVQLLLLVLLLFDAIGMSQEPTLPEIDQVWRYLNEISELKEEILVLGDQSTIKDRKITRLEFLYKQAAKSIAELSKINHTLQVEIEYKEERITELEENGQAKQLELDKLQKEKNELQSLIGSLCREMDRIKEEYTARNDQLLTRIQILKREAVEQRKESLQKSNVMYINGLNPVLSSRKISKPKTISFQLYYYPLHDEDIEKEVKAEVSIRKLREQSFMTHSVDLIREIKEEIVGGEKIRTVSYSNLNQKQGRMLTTKFEKNTTYRIYVKIKGEEIVSKQFQFR